MDKEQQPTKSRGRPKKAQPMTSQISFRCPPELSRWLETKGQKKGLGISDMARMLLMDMMYDQAPDKE